MIARAYAGVLSDADVDDVYSGAWASALHALRSRATEMGDQELRTYVLSAIATQARKELRRRYRKATSQLELEEQVTLPDSATPGVEEQAIGAEDAAVARDLLISLPERRRKVMLLRYGGGLAPKEVCSRVPGLSPRAYRKEVTKGVEAMLRGLEEIESGEWCDRRHEVVRDLASGVADDARRREAELHVAHCRSCAKLHRALDRQLGELGSLGGLLTAGAATSVAGGGGLLDGARRLVEQLLERLSEQLAALSGASATSGTVGAGVVTKLASAGVATKAALACAGAGAAATACVAAGVLPSFGVPGEREGREEPRQVVEAVGSRASTSGRHDSASARMSTPSTAENPIDSSGAHGRVRVSSEGREAPSKPLEGAAPAPQQSEFDPLARARASADGANSPAASTSSSAPTRSTSSTAPSPSHGAAPDRAVEAAPPIRGGAPDRATAEEEFGP